jgi:hypothetical protein
MGSLLTIKRAVMRAVVCLGGNLERGVVGESRRVTFLTGRYDDEVSPCLVLFCLNVLLVGAIAISKL